MGANLGPLHCLHILREVSLIDMFFWGVLVSWSRAYAPRSQQSWYHCDDSTITKEKSFGSVQARASQLAHLLLYRQDDSYRGSCEDWDALALIPSPPSSRPPSPAEGLQGVQAPRGERPSAHQRRHRISSQSDLFDPGAGDAAGDSDDEGEGSAYYSACESESESAHGMQWLSTVTLSEREAQRSCLCMHVCVCMCVCVCVCVCG